ncbi:MAG: XRE family transcriptional regulator, partial [Negativicutes bacterium]|nr:XRE family transcriptional regulator [Negativicutes bacterium]
TRSNIENCRLDTLVKIANALGCTVNDLFTDQPDPE